MEFARQIGWCISLAFKKASIHNHLHIVFQVDRTIDLFKIARCLVVRDMGGGSEIQMGMERPASKDDWEDWFEYYQWELSQGAMYEDCEEAVKEIDEAIRHFERVSANIRDWHQNFERIFRKIDEYGV